MTVTAETREPGRRAAPTSTIVTRLRDRAAEHPDRVCFREKFMGVWRDITWAEYWDEVQNVAHALLALGVQPGDRVAIHSENRPEWVFTDLATVACRGITMGLYPTNPPAEVQYLLSDSGSKILVAEDQEQVDKALEVADKCPELEKIVYIEPRGVRTYDDPRLMWWLDFVELGRQHREENEGVLERLMEEVEPDDAITMIYTSGTTGPPKGAMLTVANVEFAIQTLIEEGGFTSPPPTPDDMLLSYLPLCHVAERIFTTWFNLGAGCQIHFAESLDTVQQNLREVQPTIFLGVPRIWEKIAAGVQIKMASASFVKRMNYLLWSRVASKIGETLVETGGNHTTKTRILYALGHVFIFRTLKDRIGMRECRFAASGAAPIAPEILQWFMGIGVPMHEVYGMTENTAVATANVPGRVKLGTVGEPYPEIELRIVREDGTVIDPPAEGESEPGEIQTRHPGVFAGYWQKPDKTAEAMTEDGWLRTGDVGVWVDGTHVKIVDRLKDIIITAGAKNVSPSEIENALKASPFIKEAVVIGDRRPFLVALIGIELDTVGDWAQRRQIPYTTYRDLSEKPEVIELVQKVVNGVNEKFASAEQVKKLRMLPKELDHEDGELTATQKVKRASMEEMFADLIEEMYRR
jgi:long-chain acyl-CoA synthetase